MLQPILRVVLILLAVLAPVPAAAQEWWEAETDNFVVKSQGNREEVRAFALDLERFDATLRIFQGLPVGNRYPGRSQKLTVYRLGDNSGTGFLAGSEEPGAFYIARAGNSAAFLPRDDSAEADTAFRHEYAHYFMSQNFPASYPIWYVEGFAQVMATARSNFDNSVNVGTVPEWPATPAELPLEQLWSDAGRLAPEHHPTAMLLTHYLMMDAARLARLKTYLVALGAAGPDRENALQYLGDKDRVRTGLVLHAGNGHEGVDVDLSGYPAAEAKMRRLDPVEAGMIADEIALRRGLSGDEAGMVQARLSAPEAPEPDHPLRLELLGRAALAQGRAKEAEAYGARLATSEPERSAGFLLLSEAAMAQIGDDPEMALHAGNLARLAAGRDRTDPRPLIMYYRIALAAGEAPDERAKVALEAAYDMAGSDPRYRLLLTRHLLSLGRTEAAEAAIGPILFGGHGDDLAAYAPLVALVDEGDTPRAIAAIDEVLAQPPR